MDKSATKVLIDFSQSSPVKWNTVNDGVMGGVSQSTFKILPDSTALFKGTVSLENNGGFASVRSVPSLLDLSEFDGLEMRVKGDGHSYSFRIRTDANFDGIAYRAEFLTKKNKWMDIKLPFSLFKPTFRGRNLKNVPALQTGRIQQLGFLIAEKQEGPFYLYIDWIRAY
jgi:hypothetical protein